MATVTDLMTAEEFAARSDGQTRTELVMGRVIEMPPPGPKHGLFSLRFGRLLGNFVADHGLGEVLGESGIITRRDPDSVRGPDISFYRAARLPPVDQWGRFLDVPPDLVAEVRSPSDSRPGLVRKAAEYRAAGVLVVVVLDPEDRSALVFEADQPDRVVGPEEMLTFPALLPGCAICVGSIFA